MIDWLTYLDQLTPDWLTSEATRKSIIRYDDTRNKAQFVFVVVKVTPVFCLFVFNLFGYHITPGYFTCTSVLYTFVCNYSIFVYRKLFFYYFIF